MERKEGYLLAKLESVTSERALPIGVRHVSLCIPTIPITAFIHQRLWVDVGTAVPLRVVGHGHVPGKVSRRSLFRRATDCLHVVFFEVGADVHGESGSAVLPVFRVKNVFEIPRLDFRHAFVVVAAPDVIFEIVDGDPVVA